MSVGGQRIDPLARLASGVRPDGAAPREPAPPVEARSFERLLQSAHKGELSSGRGVTVSKSLDYAPDEALLARLSKAADAAEAAGARRALAMVGGEGLTIDLATRTIDGRASLRSAGMIGNIDAAVTLGPEDAGPAPVRGPGAGVAVNDGLAHLLAQLDSSAGGRAPRE